MSKSTQPPIGAKGRLSAWVYLRNLDWGKSQFVVYDAACAGNIEMLEWAVERGYTRSTMFVQCIIGHILNLGDELTDGHVLCYNYVKNL